MIETQTPMELAIETINADFLRASDAFCMEFFGTIERAQELGEGYALLECNHPVTLDPMTGKLAHEYHFRMLSAEEYLDLTTFGSEIDPHELASLPSTPKPE